MGVLVELGLRVHLVSEDGRAHAVVRGLAAVRRVLELLLVVELLLLLLY